MTLTITRVNAFLDDSVSFLMRYPDGTIYNDKDAQYCINKAEQEGYHARPHQITLFLNGKTSLLVMQKKGKK
jgi:hypothetical protein